MFEIDALSEIYSYTLSTNIKTPYFYIASATTKGNNQLRSSFTHVESTIVLPNSQK